MTKTRSARFDGLSLRRLCATLLLPLLLVLAQQGALLHELSHYTAPDTLDEGDQQTPDKHPCELCLAFAHIGSTATTDIVVPALLADLSFAPFFAAAATVAAAALPARRNRGPPATL